MTDCVTDFSQPLRVGFMRLVDAAPLIMAKELGMFFRYGLNVELQLQNSWSAMADKLHHGQLDAGQLLAPIPIAAALGMLPQPVNFRVPFVMSYGGNAITLSRALTQRILAVNPDIPIGCEYPLIGSMVKREFTKKRYRIAVVHPFSCQYVLLDAWLKACGLNLQDIELVVIPPHEMVAAIEQGDIDGFCSGAPWNTLATRRHSGVTVASSSDLLPPSMEKVLAVATQGRALEPSTLEKLLSALKDACAWLGFTANRFEAALLMSQPHYLDLEVGVIVPSLLDSIIMSDNQTPRVSTNYVTFNRLGEFQCNQPLFSQVELLAQRMARTGQIPALNSDTERQLTKIFGSSDI